MVAGSIICNVYASVALKKDVKKKKRQPFDANKGIGKLVAASFDGNIATQGRSTKRTKKQKYHPRAYCQTQKRLSWQYALSASYAKTNPCLHSIKKPEGRSKTVNIILRSTTTDKEKQAKILKTKKTPTTHTHTRNIKFGLSTCSPTPPRKSKSPSARTRPCS